MVGTAKAARSGEAHITVERREQGCKQVKDFTRFGRQQSKADWHGVNDTVLPPGPSRPALWTHLRVPSSMAVVPEVEMYVARPRLKSESSR